MECGQITVVCGWN